MPVAVQHDAMRDASACFPGAPPPVITALAAFAVGATLLQASARLPPRPGVLTLVALAACVAAVALALRGHGARAPPGAPRGDADVTPEAVESAIAHVAHPCDSGPSGRASRVDGWLFAGVVGAC